VPLLIALVNGLAPLSISLLILVPLFVENADAVRPVSPLYMAALIALLLTFLLGVFLGRVAGVSWLRSGIQTLLVAIATATLIYLFARQ
jgi:VIT1/CCC1 family predicted Fe2+/Mn2+ transporter